MYFKNIIGLEFTKKILYQIYKSNRVAHAFFFVGPAGYGGLPLAIAFARMLLNDKKDSNTDLKIDTLQHPDLHFIFPNSSNDKIRPSISLDFLNKWRKFIYQYPYGNIFNWLEFLEIENKQMQIGIEVVNHMIKNLQIKSYEGGYKVLIIWMPERLHIKAANKLLKILEEPPEKTVFLFVGEQYDSLLSTLRSRVQIFHLKPLPLDQMQILLQKKQRLSEKKALFISQRSEGQWGNALSLLKKTEENQFETFFIHWMRNAFIVEKKPMAIKTLIECSDTIHQWGREIQKKFLDYTLFIFRQALFTNYHVDPMDFNPFDSENFNWKVFSQYIRIENIQNIFKDVEQASRDIEQNAYAKIVFLDLSIHITKYLHY